MNDYCLDMIIQTCQKPKKTLVLGLVCTGGLNIYAVGFQANFDKTLLTFLPTLETVSFCTVKCLMTITSITKLFIIHEKTNSKTKQKDVGETTL